MIKTIGHSNHPIERFLDLLKAGGVRLLVDVRSMPYSRRFPQFGRERLAKSLREYPVPEANGIQGALDSLTHPNARTTKPASLMDTSIIGEIKKSGFIDKLYGRPPKN